MKRIRRFVSYSHKAQTSNVDAWLSLANSFRAAAEILDEEHDRIPSDSRPFVFNAALSLELLLKAILVKKQLEIPSGSTGHNLCSLCVKAQVPLDEHQMVTLELMSEEIVWAGRYPVPKREKDWNEYHDKILEKHIIRETIGNVTTVLANRKTFSNRDNYEKIWKKCMATLRATRRAE